MKFLEISKTQYKVSDFISWQKSKTLLLSPKYQRRSVWDSSKKSFFVDTIIRGLPVPIIFLRERPTELSTYESVREVVDGQQRIRTLISFANPDILKDYRKERDYFTISKAHSKELAGLDFQSLPDEYKRKILDYQFSVHVLPSDVEDRELLAIFSRLNSTGVKLNYQELRNAQFFGELKTSVYQEAYTQLNRWLDWKIFNDTAISRMDEVELSSELYIYMLKGIRAKTARLIDSAYQEYNENFSDRDIIENQFRVTMDTIDEYFRKDIPVTAFRKKTLFYVLFCVIHTLLFCNKHDIKTRGTVKFNITAAKVILQLAESISDEKAARDVLEAAERRTTHLSSRNTIYHYFISALKQ